MRWTDENSCRNMSARRDPKNFGVSGAAFPRSAPSARRLRFRRPHGLVLIVAVTTQRDRRVSTMPDLALNPPLPEKIFVLESAARRKFLP